ncbi:leucyl aminopeptidase family protein [Aliidiomarina soli]|uniref:Probable cytosol aminopeptidase n=1 Tax=Aliidiomarina soli TaxID=1928574 RepID=A0A432WJ42_9GAMM|nr:leucyl aminopeptidase family protein [Aliidiomarina soli]RUO33852.1 peptidase M17 [Aliidiomarina soli]
MKLARSLMFGAALALTSTPVLADSYLNTSIAFTQQAELEQADTVVVLVPADTERLDVPGLARSTREHLERVMQVSEFDGSVGSVLDVMAPADSQADRIVLLGVGDVTMLSRTDAEKAGASLAAHLADTSADTVVVDTQMINAASNPALLIANIAHGVDLRNYRFDRYRSEPEERPKQNFTWRATEQAEGEYNRLNGLAEGVFLARELINIAPSDSAPMAFIERVRHLEELGVEVTVLGPEQVREMGMGALYGVGQASRDGAHLLAMQWRGSDDAPLALVGKGNTFDTGGINVKSSAGMRSMKTDSAGGAAVVGAIKALAMQNAAVNVVGVVPLTQNMISRDSQVPSDVVTTGSGITVEINNTDAEGRLILSDGLWYARSQFEPRAMVDIATLTGAKVRAIGTEYSAIFSDDERILATLKSAGEAVDELVWQLPMHENYMASIRSDVADLINGGSPGASAGAMFLREFAGDTPWAHIDMAGNAMISSPNGIHPAGATGYGVRLLTEWVYQYSAQQ